ncbi:MAG TPA: type IV secretion system DNA-binding domain-containing protein [Terriglobia bacterium]|nr:type IV secretion system DNA-binding domain-containing protein [Terriglobia bacterium]
MNWMRSAQRFPYLGLGWAWTAIWLLVAPDRFLVTRTQGFCVGLLCFTIAVWRGLHQLSRMIPAELNILKLAKLPESPEMQYLGHGFQWTAKLVNQLLSLERDGGQFRERSRKSGDPGGLPILHAAGAKQEKPVFIPLSDLEGHMLVSGATRTGKTHYLQLDIVQAIERGNEAVIFIDPKGDLKVLHRAYDAAVKAGREKDFLFFSLAFPHLSCTYNPLHNFVLGMEIPDRLAGLLPGGGQSEPFKAFAWEVINIIAQAMLLAGDRPLLSKIARYAKVTSSLEELLPKVPGKTPEHEYLLALIKHPPDHYDKMVSSLKPLLSKLDTPDFRNLMSVSNPDLDWDRAIRNKRIVYMFMGSMIVKETAYAIGMLALQDLLNFIGRAYAYERAKTPVRIIVDEVGRLIFPGFVDLLSQAGGQGLMAVLAFQSVADLVSVLGQAGAQQILDNTNTKLWFRATDEHTAKTFADIAGKGPLLARRQSASYRPVLAGSDTHRRLPFEATFSEQANEQIGNLVRDDWLMQLPRGHAFIQASGYTYKVRFPLLPEPRHTFPLGCS